MTTIEREKRVMIVDDEPAARANLREVIDSFHALRIVGEFSDGQAAIVGLNRLQPDIVFLDIEMPEINGFEFAERTQHLDYQLVFTTAYHRYALDAFGTRAIDYLLKPVRPALIEKCINKILHLEHLVETKKENTQARSSKLCVRDGSANRLLDDTHIAFIEGIGRYRRIHLSQQGINVHKRETIILDITLDELETQLNPKCFYRIHRSYIVNLHLIGAILSEDRRHFVSVINIGASLPIARDKVNRFMAFW